MNTTLIDWIILVFVFAGLCFAGLMCRKKVKGVSDFMVAGRNVRKYLALGTGLVEGIGLVTIANFIQQGFLHGLSNIWLQTIDMLIVAIIFGHFGVVIVRFRLGGFITLPQYFEARYSRKTRLLVGFVTAVAGILNFAIFPIVGSQFLTHFLGLPATFPLLGMNMPTIPALMGIMLVLALLFTNLGGMISVVVTDYIQSILVACGIFIMLFFTFYTLGLTGLTEGLRENLGQAAFNPFYEGSYGIAFFVWVGLNVFFCYVAFSPTMQKVASTDSSETARKMTMISSFFNKSRLVMMMLIGIGALIYLGGQAPDDMNMNGEQWSRTAGPLFLGEILPPVFMGIVMSALCAAFVSTMDSYILSWASVIVNDVICAVKKKPMTPEGHLWCLRWVIAAIALFLFCFGVLYKPTESILEYIYLTGTMFTGIGIALVFGLYFKFGTTAGAMAAVLSSAVLPVVDLICKRVFEGSYTLGSQYSGLMIILFSMMIYIAVSLADKTKKVTVD
ncbi:MAG: sodium:solute symporter [Sedimentisphaeraceae bacterium JB056]